jgi:PAS domain S-box-containing protein
MPTTHRGLFWQAFFNGNGVARRLIVALVLFSTVLTGVITAIQLYERYQADVQRIGDGFRFIKESAAPALTNSVWVVDNAQIKTQLDGLLRLRDVEFIGIYVDGTLRWSAGEPVSSRVLTDRITLSHPYRGRDVDIGEVRVSSSLDKVWSRLYGHLISVLIENGIKTLLVSAFMLLIVQIMVTRHLAKLSNYAQALRVQGLEGEDVHLDRPASGRWRPDALDHLTQAMNSMRQNLRSAYEEMNDANARLRMSEALFRSMAEVAPVGIFHADPSGASTYTNEQWCEMAGISREASMGNGWAAAIHPDDRERVFAEWTKAATERKRFASEFRFQHPDGKIIWAASQSQAETGPDGEVLAYVGTVIDITERKRTEDALKNMNEELERRVEQRTAELIRASNAKTEFLSRMSHELRTPLNAILGFGQLLEYSPEIPLHTVHADYVQEILRAGRHLLELINEVLDLARIESGRLDIHIEPIAAGALIQECMALVRPIAEKQHVVASIVSPASSSVLADRLRLRQVLLNLLSNAIKYNREGGSIEIACQTMTSGRLRITVRDTGHGIAVESFPRLFQPFERLEASFTGIEGAGIGLALSKRLIEAMNGSIGAQSIAGEGSTFWIEMPLSRDAAPEPAPVITEAPVDGEQGGHTVLYVEDSPANLRLVRMILLRRPDLTLIEAHTAELGLEIAFTRRPDLILLDINLPGIDGFEALRRLRNEPATRTVPVIAITANAMPSDIKKGREAGFTDYLVKPLDVQKFLDVIDRLVAASAVQEDR